MFVPPPPVREKCLSPGGQTKRDTHTDIALYIYRLTQEGNGILKKRFHRLNPWNVWEFWFWVPNTNSTFCKKLVKIFCVAYTEICVQCTGFCVPYTEIRFAHTDRQVWGQTDIQFPPALIRVNVIILCIQINNFRSIWLPNGVILVEL